MKPNFFVDTAKRVNEISLCQLEFLVPKFIETREQDALLRGAMLERMRREKFWNPGSR